MVYIYIAERHIDLSIILTLSIMVRVNKKRKEREADVTAELSSHIDQGY